MNNNKFKAGFSLIELAIVILVVGILIAGVVQGSSIITKASIKSARALTKSSPVSSLGGLLLWLDTTSENNFTEFANSEVSDRDPVGKWSDTNPNVTFHNTATQSTPNKKPIYTTSALGNLPALKFDGSNDQLAMSPGFVPTGNAPDIINTFSVFIVAKALATIETDSEQTSGTSGTGGQKYILYPEGGMIYNSYLPKSVGAGVSFGTNGVGFYEHTSAYMPALMVYSKNLPGTTLILSEYNNKTPSLYVNGEFARTGLTSPKVPFLFQYVGGDQWGFFNGYIGEIIVFDRVLKSSDRKAVHDYLKQKWNILAR
jgi:prepilin-type N-terminal cleavage/methylation domain-containing protein